MGVGGESSNCARGRVSSRRGGRAGDNFSGARAAGGREVWERARSAAGAGRRGEPREPREPRPAPCAAAAACSLPPGSQPRVLRLQSINSRLQLRLCAHTLTSERRKVRLKVSAAAAAAPHSASGRGNYPPGIRGLGGDFCRVAWARVGDSGGVGAGLRAPGHVLEGGTVCFALSFPVSQPHSPSNPVA